MLKLLFRRVNLSSCPPLFLFATKPPSNPGSPPIPGNLKSGYITPSPKDRRLKEEEESKKQTAKAAAKNASINETQKKKAKPGAKMWKPVQEPAKENVQQSIILLN